MVDELNAARIESRVFIPYSGPAAKSARWPSVSGTMTVYPVGDERAEHRRLDIGDDSAEPESARNRIRRFVIAVERVIGGLVGDHFRLVELDRWLDDRGDVDGRFAGLAGRPVEQLSRLEQRREAEDVVAKVACFQHRSWRDAIQGIGVGVERIVLRLRSDRRDDGHVAAIRVPNWLQWCGHRVP